MHEFNTMVKMLALLMAATLLAACSGTPSSHHSSPALSAVHIDKALQHKIDQHYREWKGTPYKLGGMNKGGIDCSGFVKITYREVFDTQVPRTTELLSDSGKKVSLADAQVGDLLLFKTGLFKRHVGIYIGNGQFIHASSSRGVIASSIKNPYWADAYQQTRRLIGS